MLDTEYQDEDYTLRMKFYEENFYVTRVSAGGQFSLQTGQYYPNEDTLTVTNAAEIGTAEKLLKHDRKLYFALNDSGQYDTSYYLTVRASIHQ